MTLSSLLWTEYDITGTLITSRDLHRWWMGKGKKWSYKTTGNWTYEHIHILNRSQLCAYSKTVIRKWKHRAEKLIRASVSTFDGESRSLGGMAIHANTRFHEFRIRRFLFDYKVATILTTLGKHMAKCFWWALQCYE